MRWIVFALVAFFGVTVCLLYDVGASSHCAIWHRGDPWTFLVVATVAANGVIAVCYFGIPALISIYVIELRRSRLPRWLSLLTLSFACFVLWCGLTHVDAVLARPVVYCTSSLIVKLGAALFSLTSLVGCAICTKPILLLIALVARSRLLAPILELESPFETAAVLRQALQEADHG